MPTGSERSGLEPVELVLEPGLTFDAGEFERLANDAADGAAISLASLGLQAPRGRRRAG